MKLFPAIKATMGRWDYYLIRMSMNEVAKNVGFYHEMEPDSFDQLSGARQRQLDTARATGEIATYLSRQRDRFFSSLVIATLGGEPKWIPVEINDSVFHQLLGEDTRFGHTFGVLKFDGSEKYYALDGQHRLAAIRSLVDKASQPYKGDRPVAPFDFSEEEISVLIVAPRGEESHEGVIRRYRRLFADLNRYARPTSHFENIIMDEDDVIAIITRQLVTEHPLFKVTGSQYKSHRVKIAKGKNLTKTDPHFTTLETLYAVNIELLKSGKRIQSGWTDRGDSSREEVLELFIRFRPTDKEITFLYEELSSYWDAITVTLPILNSPEPRTMRDHSDNQDCVLFWPIIQQNILAKVVRELIDRESTEQPLEMTLAPLTSLIWSAHKPPWQHIMLVEKYGSWGYHWAIASEGRKDRMELCRDIVRWQLRLRELDSEELNDLREEWESYLPALEDQEIEKMWQKILDGKLER